MAVTIDGTTGVSLVQDGVVTPAKLSGVTQGITMADTWRLTSAHTSDGDVTANLERDDSYSPALIGTGMSQASGVFSFPSTGIYLIIANINCNNGGDDTAELFINATEDNSTYQQLAVCAIGINGVTVRGQNATCQAIFDVTNVSTHKVKFSTNSMGSGTQLNGDTNTNRTHFLFIRLGDT